MSGEAGRMIGWFVAEPHHGTDHPTTATTARVDLVRTVVRSGVSIVCKPLYHNARPGGYGTPHPPVRRERPTNAQWSPNRAASELAHCPPGPAATTPVDHAR
jgi:hypothetical protein